MEGLDPPFFVPPSPPLCVQCVCASWVEGGKRAIARRLLPLLVCPLIGWADTQPSNRKFGRSRLSKKRLDSTHRLRTDVEDPRVGRHGKQTARGDLGACVGPSASAVHTATRRLTFDV